MSKILDGIAAPLDERFDMRYRLRKRVFEKPVPKHARAFWYCFGGLTFTVALMQALTGIFLSFYYTPTPERAYQSVFYISNYVNYGWLVRSLHVWGAHLMVIFIIIHMLRVLVTASYKHPREFNWVVGVVLFVITMGFGLTGYLLPWDQKAYWGSTVTISLMQQVPIVGDWIAQIVMGGAAIGAPTLTRFYSAHVFLLPGALMIFLISHFWMIRKQGISGPL
ncbi:MAG: cytochrome b N-terminal domain-containing protein [Coriobacteriia bacterium]|nr:cytochrome b N-terminal domain-containing protein [Coriobacteriia bacterium]